MGGEAKKREIRELYDQTAVFYDRRYREIQLQKYRLAERYLSPCERLLEVGCGTGLYLHRLRKLAKVLVGIDLSGGMLRRARGRGTLLVLADAEQLPFKDGTFDEVLSVTTLQNLPDPVRALAEMRRVLHAGGRLVVSSLRKKHSLRTLKEMVRDAGFRILEGIDEKGCEDVFVIATKEDGGKL